MSSMPSSRTSVMPTVSPAKSRSTALQDYVEHRFGIGDRAADRGEDFARGALLIERLLGFVEQADVLERDRRLVAEGPQQRRSRGR